MERRTTRVCTGSQKAKKKILFVFLIERGSYRLQCVAKVLFLRHVGRKRAGRKKRHAMRKVKSKDKMIRHKEMNIFLCINNEFASYHITHFKRKKLEREKITISDKS